MGFSTKEVTTEYAVDEQSGELKVVKQKVNEKSVPPNADIIKLIYQHYADVKTDYSSLSDEELENEKQRLISQLKEEENASAKRKNKN